MIRCVLAFTFLFAAFGLTTAATAADPEQKAELRELKKKNKQLKRELAKKKAEFPQLFEEITTKEEGANWKFARTSAVVSHPAASKDYPARGATHMSFSFKRMSARVVCPFADSRPRGKWLIYNARANTLKTR